MHTPTTSPRRTCRILATALAATGTPYEFHLQGFAPDGGRWHASHGGRIVDGGGPTTFTDESGSLPSETSAFGQATTDVDAADLGDDGLVDRFVADSITSDPVAVPLAWNTGNTGPNASRTSSTPARTSLRNSAPSPTSA